MRFDKLEIDEIINDWCNDNYGLQIYIDKDDSVIQELKEKFDRK